MANTVLDTVQALQRAPSLLKIRELLGNAAADYGYDYLLCTSAIPPTETTSPEQAMFLDWPPEWRRLYREKRLFVCDPVLSHLKETIEPFRWSDIRTKDASRDATRMMEDAASFGMREGLAVPIYGIGGRLHCITMAGPTPRSDAKAFTELHLLAMYAYARAKRLRTKGPEPRIQITLREREALVWAAAGKTDAEIATVLGIGESAAHKRIESAKRKYGVSTRVQAIVEALRRGHISV